MCPLFRAFLMHCVKAHWEKFDPPPTPSSRKELWNITLTSIICLQMIVIKSLLAFLLLSIGSEMAAADTCAIGNIKQFMQKNIKIMLAC